jgi:O-antigen/teichoic acid export membrane protein
MLLGDSAVYIAGRVLPSAVAFVTAVLLTWELSPDAYGDYGLCMAVVVLGNNALFDWLALGVLRWFQTHGRDAVFISTVLSLFGAVCAGSAVLLGLATALGLAGDHAREAWLVLAGLWAYAWFELASRFQIGLFRPWRYLTMNVARSTGILAGSVALARLTHAAVPVLAASFFAMALSGCLFAADGTLPWRPTFDRKLARDLAAYGGPMGVTMMLYGLTTSANRLLLGALSTSAAVGAFTIGFTLVQTPLTILSAGIGAASYSAAVRAAESEGPAAARAQLCRNYATLLALLLPAGIALALLAPGIAALAVNPHYQEAVTVTAPWLAASSVLMGMRATYVDTAFQLGKRPWLLVQVMATSAAANILLGVALIPRFSTLGACIAMCLASGLALAHAVLLAPRAYPLPFPRRETAAVVLATAAMAAGLAVARSWPGLAGLVGAIAFASFLYASAAVLLNVLGLRAVVRERWIALRAVPSPRPRQDAK